MTLIRIQDAEKLGIIIFNKEVQQIEENQIVTQETLIKKYKDVFDGKLGKIAKKCGLKANTKPIIN